MNEKRKGAYMLIPALMLVAMPLCGASPDLAQFGIDDNVLSSFSNRQLHTEFVNGTTSIEANVPRTSNEPCLVRPETINNISSMSEFINTSKMDIVKNGFVKEIGRREKMPFADAHVEYFVPEIKKPDYAKRVVGEEGVEIVNITPKIDTIVDGVKTYDDPGVHDVHIDKEIPEDLYNAYNSGDALLPPEWRPRPNIVDAESTSGTAEQADTMQNLKNEDSKMYSQMAEGEPVDVSENTNTAGYAYEDETEDINRPVRKNIDGTVTVVKKFNIFKK